MSSQRYTRRPAQTRRAGLSARAAGPVGATWLLKHLGSPGARLVTLTAIAIAGVAAYLLTWGAERSRS